MALSNSSKPAVAVIGAGFSGLVCARRLQDHEFDVTVFEKSRGAGGRMSTRRAGDGLRFDHGAQYFTVRDDLFAKSVDEWRERGVVALWNARIGTLNDGGYHPKETQTPRYVGVPGMNSIGKHLATDVTVTLETRVSPPEWNDGRWTLSDDSETRLGDFDAVIVSAPAAQSAELLNAAPELQQVANNIPMSGCWAVLLAFPESLGLPFDGAFVEDSPLSWIARNSSKPGRDELPETWVLHASSEWSEAHLERQPNEMLFQLTEAFWQVTGLSGREPLFLTAHRWRYALPPEPHGERCLFDAGRKIGACGDWCGGPRVEGAFLSGHAVAERVLTEFGIA